MQFSIIIPTFNREHYLREAIASALRQADAEFEILVVNDGDELRDNFADPRIRILENHRRGAVAARNLAVAASQAEYIAFLDDDDWWIDLHHLSNSSKALQAGCGLYFADGILKHMDGTPDQVFAEPADAQSLRSNNTILMSAVCYRRELHERLGLFDPALPYYYDWDWYLRVVASGYQIQRHAQPSVAIRVHQSSDSAAANQELRRQNLELLCKKHGLGPLPMKRHADFAS